MDTIGDASAVVFWQLAFWPPDREVVVSAKRSFAPRIMARIAILELAVIEYDRHAAVPESYACTYPGCGWGPGESARHLANHRFAAHQIRSTNEESMRRQERRDNERARKFGAAPEYIDRAHIRAALAVPAPAGVAIKDGPLDVGDREHVRKRLCHFIASALCREVRRSPAEVCLAVAELAASALASPYPKISKSARADVQTERLTQLFSKTPALATA